MQECDYLAAMNSKFVSSLAYSFADDENIYLVIDIMLCGDLKYRSFKFSF